MAEQLADLLKQLQEAESAETAPPAVTPLERTLTDGTKVSGKDYDELFANVEAHYGKPKEEAKAPIPFPVQAAPAKAPAETPKVETLDIEDWARTLQRDPVAAQAMVDRIRFGADPVAKLREMEQMLQAQNQMITAKEVRSWQKSNKDIDLKTHGAVLDNLLKSQNLAITEENLDYVTGQAQQYGWIPRKEAKIAPPAPPVAPQTPAPATKTGAGLALITELMKKMDDPDLTPDQRRSLMVQAGGFDPGSESRFNSLG